MFRCAKLNLFQKSGSASLEMISDETRSFSCKGNFDHVDDDNNNNNNNNDNNKDFIYTR